MRACAWLLALILAVPGSAQASVLIEARIAGTPVRLVADRHLDRVLLTAGSTRALFDLAGGLVYASEDGGTAQRLHARYRPGHHEPPPYRIEPFGPGPVLAGYVTTYHVLFVGEQVCAELTVSGWMTAFVDPAIRALALLEQAVAADGDPCQNIPFATYAAAGWPIMAGKIDRPTIETTRIAFDYRPQGDELTPPTRFEEGDIQDLREIATAAGL
ncbi:MAG: hypothetical protein ACREH3_00645 [Geminicoccales bacterium]